MMIRLNNDYSEGCHPSILLRLNEMNLEQNPGYGTDTHCAEAADAVRKAFACPDADVHFLVGGTQANMTVIAAALRPYEAVLCADTGHINVHETGAVEGTGHKCIALQSRDGRISASQISVAAAMLDDNEHVAKPAMVYISMSTELGTVYNRAQLRDIYLTCQKLGLYLFIDGARLGYALAAPTGDLTAADIAEMCDVFTVGGTKMGALFGEAIVINHPSGAEEAFPPHDEASGRPAGKGLAAGCAVQRADGGRAVLPAGAEGGQAGDAHPHRAAGKGDSAACRFPDEPAFPDFLR